MYHFKKHSKLYMPYIRTAFIVVLFLLVAVPFSKKVAGNGTGYSPDSRYMVVLNGNELGYVGDRTVAESALLSARAKLSGETSGLSLVESSIDFYEDNVGGSVLTEDEITNKIYMALAADVIDDSNVAYTVRIDDFTITLSSKDEVSELLEMVKDKYSDSNEFTVELVEDYSDSYEVLKTNFVSADVTVNEAAKVLVTADDGTVSTEVEADDGTVYTNGVLSVNFAENIEIIETNSAGAAVISVEEAYELITKEHAQKDVHTVAAGDCLTSIADVYGLTIAELLAMNPGINQDTILYEGDVLVVTVPASEISVVVVEETSYEESYNSEVQYIDNPALYAGNNTVIQQGSEGYRSVVALVTYVNGVESDRSIISQEVITESVPQIIERGTLTPPTYIKPISGGSISSPYGYRIHPITGVYSLHTGTDWYVPTGTAVMASATGTVISAGWNGGYGYCVQMRHSDGSVTKYAHLSSIAVSYGQNVMQGQVVGYSGSTGNSTGPHLHFEIIINGATVNPVEYVGY